MKAKEMIKEIYTRFYRLVSRNKRIENASKLIEGYTDATSSEDSADELIIQSSTQENIRSLQESAPSLKERLHKLKVNSCLERYEETLVEEDQLIEEEKSALKTLSTLIEQKNKALQMRKKKLALNVKLFDILSQSNGKSNIAKSVKPIEISPPIKVIPFEQKENLQTNKRLQA
ncbi:hypothetical protein [Bartonella bovis]|uniref:Uncharacterized protein n=1 Tax=Bartonella bovis m02 TaxID=1094492 RepID=N6VIW1_9HYPH|nr:hypothetical protein [Bartonella bovis]ENN93815.1 hypothetical protein m02_08340 [Bartonella bovis m02]